MKQLTAQSLRSWGQRIARLERYCQVRFRNKFAGVTALLERFIPANAVIFDIGANHGEFAKQFAQLHGGSCKVFCFEPLEYSFTLLRTVMKSFANVKIFPVALSTEQGSRELFVPVKIKSHRIGPSYAHLGSAGCEGHFTYADDSNREIASVIIVTDTLDNIVEREKLTRLDFIKIDVEGAESLVFKGGRESIARHKPVILCEIDPRFPPRLGLTAQDSAQPLLELGYRMFVYFKDSGEMKSPDEKNRSELNDYIFIHPDNPLCPK